MPKRGKFRGRAAGGDRESACWPSQKGFGAVKCSACPRSPESSIAGSNFAGLDHHTDGAAYELARQLWMSQTETHPEDTAILGNAASFLTLCEKIKLRQPGSRATRPRRRRCGGGQGTPVSLRGNYRVPGPMRFRTEHGACRGITHFGRAGCRRRLPKAVLVVLAGWRRPALSMGRRYLAG